MKLMNEVHEFDLSSLLLMSTFTAQPWCHLVIEVTSKTYRRLSVMFVNCDKNATHTETNPAPSESLFSQIIASIILTWSRASIP
jgi:hypothetical protein